MDVCDILTIVIDCGPFITNVALWLVAIGKRGATVDELVTAISSTLDVKLNVVKALEIMEEKGWVERFGNSGNKFRAMAIDYDSRAYARMRGALSRFSIDDVRYVLSRLSREYRKRNQNETGKKVTTIRRIKVGPQKCNGTLEDKRSQNDINKSSEIKTRRIKIHGPKSSIDKFRNMVSDDVKEKFHGPGKRYTNIPSQYPHLNQWRQKENPNRWTGLDWCGYWLTKWLKLYGREDPKFCGQSCPRSAGRELDVYRELGLGVIRFRDSGRGFKGDGNELREYLDWLFDDFLPAATWMKTPIISVSAFRIKNNTFLDQFRVRSVKVKAKSKEQRHHWGMSRE